MAQFSVKIMRLTGSVLSENQQLGAQINGSAKDGFATETMSETNKRRDDLLRQK